MQIFRSRFTPNATGDQISLLKRETVKYQTQNEGIVEAVIQGERMSNKMCPNLGYEAITLDDNELCFLDGKRIIHWRGKAND